MRVASMPSRVFVRHLSDPADVKDSVRLQDPVAEDGRIVPWGWWPPVMLEPGWVTANQKSCGVFDFTTDNLDADSLRRAVEDAYRRWTAGEPSPRASWPERRAERTAIAAAHDHLYEDALR